MTTFHRIATTALVFVIASTQAHASMEGLLRMSGFAIESPGIGESGPVKVSGAQSAQGITLLRIEAFGKNFVLSPAQLEGLKGFGANGVQITYEQGYKNLGGRTIYVIFSRGFTSGHPTQRYVSVAESGKTYVDTCKAGCAPN